MRPLRLEVEGFGAFRDATAIDFTGLDLAALVGPTGSGKSTIIDALTFALYGSVARYDNPARVAPVIHQLATEAKVRLDFELGGRRYVAVRIVRRVKADRSGALRATTREARLEVAGHEGGTTVLAGTVTDLDQEVQRLIGLDFTQFTRTIVLPQGEFAELLTDDPSSRQTLIRRLLELDIYARMGGLARERAGQAQQQAEAYQHERDRLVDVTPERLTDAEARVAALERFAGAAGELLGELAIIDEELTERRTDVNRLDAALTALQAVAVPDGLREAGAAVALAREELEAASEARQRVAAERDEAGEALEATGDPVELQALLQHRRRLVELEQAVTGLSAEAAAATDEQALLTGELARAEQQAAAAVEALRAARAGTDAAAWVAQLRAGEPCPICRQPVSELPGHETGVPEAEAEAEAARCQGEQSRLTSAVARAEGRLQALEADLAQRSKEAEELAARLVGVAGTDELAAEVDRALVAAERVKRVARELRAADDAVAAATTKLSRAEVAERGYAQRFVDQRDTVAEHRPPSPAGQSLADDWRALSSWAAGKAAELAERRIGLAETGRRLASAKADLLARLAASAEPLGVDPSPDRLLASAAAAQATASAAVSRLAEQLEHKRELAELVGRLSERQTVYGALGRQHLSASGFERWLLAEALEAIVERATIRLLELSTGRYSLEVVDGSFAVRDHGNADERRDVRTLSGGETFLASLALALALSESITELASVDAPRLDSIFLDEGFGSLDGETLDVAATAIEELSASGRLVVIVTHVRDLADRMPVRFEVSKGPATSSVERVEG